jgi:Domain of unknown function (DUF4332)
MERDNFGLFLKKAGKKPHVIDGLICQVEKFEQYLIASKGRGLESAKVEDILSFADGLEKKRQGSARQGVRGVALYYRFANKPNLAKAATDLREQRIAKTRKAFPLKKFLGISPEHIAALEKIGITHADRLLTEGATNESRQELARRTGIPVPAILELVKLSDLSRMDGVKSIRTRLYYDAGVDTIEKMARQNPEEMLRITSEFVKRTNFNGIPPLPKEVFHTIKTAQELPIILKE